MENNSDNTVSMAEQSEFIARAMAVREQMQRATEREKKKQDNIRQQFGGMVDEWRSEHQTLVTNAGQTENGDEEAGDDADEGVENLRIDSNSSGH